MPSEYALVGDSVRVLPLPVVFAGIKGFYLLAREDLRKYGWLPVEDELAEISDTQTHGEPSFRIEAHRVVRFFPAVNKPQEQVDVIQFKAEALVAQLLSMTPAEIFAWIETNVTDLSSAKAVLKRLAVSMVLLARRLN